MWHLSHSRLQLRTAAAGRYVLFILWRLHSISLYGSKHFVSCSYSPCGCFRTQVVVWFETMLRPIPSVRVLRQTPRHNHRNPQHTYLTRPQNQLPLRTTGRQTGCIGKRLYVSRHFTHTIVLPSSPSSSASGLWSGCYPNAPVIHLLLTRFSVETAVWQNHCHSIRYDILRVATTCIVISVRDSTSALLQIPVVGAVCT